MSALDLIDHHLDHSAPLGNVLAQLHLPTQFRHLCGQVINNFLGRLHGGTVVHSPQTVALFRALIRKSFETGSDILREVPQVLCRHDVIGGKKFGFLAVPFYFSCVLPHCRIRRPVKRAHLMREVL